MLAKLTTPHQLLTHLATRQSQQNKVITLDYSIMGKQTCPCCSDTLLRHMRFGGLYWRCSSCHQEMPI
ncbi:hypothetical protein Mic7113_1514 [Allocoleopsis franciscana PCC 7113]|uniref:Uncharacterized protein n=1 Tax=Allocoleopsis franciscana PCC 7113 TaxID=1173027 RepID=K9WAI2_9CYAN|nr:hypothetical protein Mic7113_1514 [Allocoleopsis franciscana PCC 7113]